MKIIIFFGIVLFLLQSCSKKNVMVQEKDYKPFLNKKFVQQLDNNHATELAFWNNKLNEDTGSFICKMQIGQQLLSDFKVTGSVQKLKLADSLFLNSAAKLNHTDPAMYLALSQNAITQHRFKDAERYLLFAEKNNADAYTVHLLKFDIHMELGNYVLAEKSLFVLAAKSRNFDYIIRKSKFEDHLGNSDQSILEMEKAFEMVRYGNKKNLKNWVCTNLADMYSHAERIKDAYQMYLTALQSDSANLYALKGIATICFVQDHNTKAAENIYNFILSCTQAPDIYLNLAEIAKWKKDTAMEKYYEQQFLTAMENPDYGDMYNQYIINLYLNKPEKMELALQIAEKEIRNRATPETYSWLALANYKMNYFDKANAIIQTKVLEQTKEPDALFTAAVILNKSNPRLTKDLIKNCKQSSFELGPFKMQELKNLNSNLDPE